MQENEITPTITTRLLEYVRADRAIRSSVGSVLSAHDITMMQWLLLSVVCDGPDDGITMSTAARTLHVTLPQVTALTNELLKTKLIKQKSQSFDRRTRMISPTKKGSDIMEKTLDMIESTVMGMLSEASPRDHATYWQIIHTLGDDSPKE